MDTGLITLLLFSFLIIILASGTPIAFGLGTLAIIFGLFIWGPDSLNFVHAQTLSIMLKFIFTAIPLFILMAAFLERSGIADSLYGFMYSVFGRINGGLAVGTVIICTIFAAMAGISGAATVTMGLVALPSMFKRGYDRRMVMGSIMAGGALGILIPPSVPFVLYGVVAGESIGRLLAGGVFPGLLLSSLFIIYILIRCHFQPNLGPVVPVEERASFREIVNQSKSLILPIIIVLLVIGAIFSGIATPTEAAALGCMGTLVAVGVNKKLSWNLVNQSCQDTLRLTAMIGWIGACALWVATVYQAVGGQEFATNLVNSLGVNRWFIMVGIQLIYIFLGCFLDPSGIIFITIPVFVPIIKTLGFDPVWFGVLFVVNMEMAYLTPPFGVNLFYMKGMVPKDVSMGDIYRSIIPFVLLQLTGLIICMIFPQICLYLPNLIFGK